MKRLLAYLFIVLGLTFSLQSWTKADDIRDFEIEGMSIGDSLLDYFSEEEINKKIDNEELITYPGSDKYYGMSFGNENFFKTYEFIKFHMKKNDKKFTIVSITGVIDYPNNFEDCLKTKKKLLKKLKNLMILLMYRIIQVILKEKVVKAFPIFLILIFPVTE